jgi:hypothetical protein
MYPRIQYKYKNVVPSAPGSDIYRKRPADTFTVNSYTNLVES